MGARRPRSIIEFIINSTVYHCHHGEELTRNLPRQREKVKVILKTEINGAMIFGRLQGVNPHWPSHDSLVPNRKSPNPSLGPQVNNGDRPLVGPVHPACVYSISACGKQPQRGAAAMTAGTHLPVIGPMSSIRTCLSICPRRAAAAIKADTGTRRA